MSERDVAKDSKPEHYTTVALFDNHFVVKCDVDFCYTETFPDTTRGYDDAVYAANQHEANEGINVRQ